MNRRQFLAAAFAALLLVATGCSNGNNPINKGKDMPVEPPRPKTDKDKDK